MKARLFFAVFLAAAVYLQWQGARLDDKEARLDKVIATLKHDNEQQRIKNIALKSDIDAIRLYPDEIFEELSREKLFMIMPDEIYVLPDGEAQ